MRRENGNYYSTILEQINEFKSDSKLDSKSDSDIAIILTSLYPDGTSKKRIIKRSDLSNPKIVLSPKLSHKIIDILDSGKSTGFVTLADETDKEISYIIEVIQSLNSLIILGAGHVGRSLSLIASILGFDVTLIDDREEFLRDDHISTHVVRKLFMPFDNYTKSLSITSRCAIVIVTRGHQFDEICLKNATCTDARYIGMIGSKRRVLSILQNLRNSGLSERHLLKLDNVYAPIGLEINAKSPQEIAISILAQIIKVMNDSHHKEYSKIRLEDL